MKGYYSLGISAFSDLGDAVIRLGLPAGAKLYDVKIYASTRDLFPHTLTVMDINISYKVMPEMSPRGEYLFGFDTIFTDLHLFGMFAEWDDDAGMLRLSFPD